MGERTVSETKNKVDYNKYLVGPSEKIGLSNKRNNHLIGTST